MDDTKPKRQRNTYINVPLKIVIPNSGGQILDVTLRFPAALADAIRWDQTQNAVSISTGGVGAGASVATSSKTTPVLAGPTEPRQQAEDPPPPPGFHSSSTLTPEELEKQIAEQNFNNAVNNVGTAPKAPTDRSEAARKLRTISVDIPGVGAITEEVHA